MIRRSRPQKLNPPWSSLHRGKCRKGTRQNHCGSRSSSKEKLRYLDKARPHFQLNRNSLALKSTRVGDVPNHNVELSRSTNIIVAAGAKSRNVVKIWLEKQPVPLFDHRARLLLPFVRLPETSGTTSKALQRIVVLKIDFECLRVVNAMVQHLIVGLVEGVITPGAPRFLSTSHTTCWEEILKMFLRLN